jgi:uncharacterized protein YndB with AHSA1/START domain
MVDRAVASVGPDVRSFTVETTVAAPPSEVWRAWTSAEEIESWWGPPESNIELRVGGPFEILFNMDEPSGRQGSEGCVYLAYVPDQMISFTWNAPPHLALREAHTWVVVSFDPMGGGGTGVRLTHSGFLIGPDWDAYMEYFTEAWEYVLSLLTDNWAD